MKTRIDALEDKQEIMVTREFDIPVELLFRAYTEPDIVEQWMGTRVLKLENRKHGSYQFETTDPKGNRHRFNGVIHEYIPDRTIIRTFEMENTLFTVQLEFLDFERLTGETSKLNMQIVFRSVAYRDQQLHMPFARGISMAHDRLQDVVSKLRTADYEKER